MSIASYAALRQVICWELATFRLIISFATARALAVTISASLLVRADELIG